MPTSTAANKIAFVAGATGYTGSHLVPLLVQQGWIVYAHVRPDSSSLEHWRSVFESQGAIVDTTPWDEAAIGDRFETLQPTAIFALLGTTKKRGKGAQSSIADTYEAVDYGLTALLRRAAEAQSPHARFVYLSAYGVQASSRNPYNQARAKLEAELREGTLDYVILRPALIAGDRDEPRPLESAGAAAIAGVIGTLRLFGASKAAGDFRTRSGAELAQNCIDAATFADSGAELTGAAMDALRAANA